MDKLPIIKGGQGREGWALYRQAARCWPGLYRIMAVSLFFVCFVLALLVVQRHQHRHVTTIHTVTIETVKP